MYWVKKVVTLSVAVSACAPNVVALDAGDEPADGAEADTRFDPFDSSYPPPTTAAALDDEAGTHGFVTSDANQACGVLCDPWNASDCDAGTKCAPASCETGSQTWDTTVCRPVMGDRQPGEACSVFGDALDGVDDCAEGSFCWDPMPDTGFGRCVSWCTGTPNNPGCDQPDHVCNVWKSLGVGMCTPLCDPRIVGECPLGCTCLPTPSDEGFTCVLDASGGMAPYGTPCEFANVCNPGLLCVDSSVVPEESCWTASGCCTPVCDLALDTPCPGAAGGQECVPFYEPGTAPEGYDRIGACTIPV